MGQETELALQMQTLDRRIDELRREIAALPKRVAEIEKQLTSHRRRLEADQAALQANEKERRRLEAEIKGHEEKISRLRDQMLDAKTNEQYTAFQKEIEFCEKEIRKAEDRVLDLMETSESLGEAVSAAEAALEQESEHVEREKQTVRERTARNEKEFSEAKTERKAAAEKLDPALYARYERIRERYGFPVISEVVNGRCGVCNIALRPQYYQELRKTEEPKVCETCGRLFYYHRPIDVEAERSPV